MTNSSPPTPPRTPTPEPEWTTEDICDTVKGVADVFGGIAEIVKQIDKH